MKHLISFLLLILASAATASAEDTMTFIVGSGVASPITVSVGGRTYTVNSSITVPRANGSIRATDANGRKLTYKFRHSGSNNQGFQDTYTFINTYNPGDGSSSSSGGYSSGGGGGRYSTSGGGYHNPLFQLGGGADGEAYPGLKLMAGVSRTYGEFVRFRYTGYGFNGYAGIGKDWIVDGEFKNRILWHVGIGSYFAFGGNGDPNMDVSIGLSAGGLAQYDKVSLMIDADYTYWIGRWRRVGLFAGASLGWGSFSQVFNTDDYNEEACSLTKTATVRNLSATGRGKP